MGGDWKLGDSKDIGCDWSLMVSSPWRKVLRLHDGWCKVNVNANKVPYKSDRGLKGLLWLTALESSVHCGGKAWRRGERGGGESVAAAGGAGGADPGVRRETDAAAQLPFDSFWGPSL